MRRKRLHFVRSAFLIPASRHSFKQPKATARWTAIREALIIPMGNSAARRPNWRLGTNHSAEQWANKMAQRGWTEEQITEAIQNGQRIGAVNTVNPPNGATRCIHPASGRSVVIDNVTSEVIHVGGDGFVY